MQEIISMIFNPMTLLIIAFGCTFGVALGCIPGLNGGIGISLLLPFTFAMEPSQALLLLSGIFMGSSYGGSISAILLNVPGTAEAYCTSLDGYPMAQKKQGKSALYLAVLSSVIGGLIGVLALVFFAPVLARLALKFGPPEYFLVGMVGLTVVGGLAGKNAFKGIASVCIGLLLGMIGFDTITGGARLTYGNSDLMMGIELMPVILGIFALTKMLVEISKMRNTSKKTEVESIQELGNTTIWDSLKLVLANIGTVIKSSAIGTFIGILPGPGAAISSFLSYSEAKRSKKAKAYGDFGKGNPVGVIAAESANNAAVGGSLVPMLSLGIPGSPTAAMIYGAMVIHGLQAGPRLFVDNPVIAYTFTYGMLLTVILMGIVGIFFVPVFTRILNIPMKYIVVSVISCTLLGAYSIRNSMFDVYVMCAAGFFGYFLEKFEVPSSPVVLGIILSKLIETNFRLSMTLAKADGISVPVILVTRPICLIIIAVGVLLVYLNLRSSALEKKEKESQGN